MNTAIAAGAPPPLPELRLCGIPAASRARYAGDRFSFMEAGDPALPPLVLLHGVGANSMHWRFQFAGLSDRWRVVAWNAPGYVLSDNLLAETPTGRDYADALADFLDSLHLGRVHLFGNSFGTRVAQLLALHHPDRVGRLVLTGTGIGRESMPEDEKAKAIAARAAQIAPGGYAFGARVAALLGSRAGADTARLVQDVLRATQPRGFMQAVRFGLNSPYTPAHADRLTMPVLLIQGEEDRVNPAESNAAVLARALPQARLIMMPGVGHLPEVEAWQEVNTAVRAFLLL